LAYDESYIYDLGLVKGNRLQNHKKVILFPSSAKWSFHDYVEGDWNPIEDWYEGLSEAAKFQFDSLLKQLSKTEDHLQWLGFKYLKGEPKKERVWQLDFIADGRQYRVLGVFGSVRKQAVMLLGCYHKGKVYTPPDALTTATKRAKKIKDKKAGTRERSIKNDI
jgi:hypothetical protein